MCKGGKIDMNKQVIKRFIASLWPPVYREGVLILNYHSINPNNAYSLLPDVFEKQMEYLQKNYTVISLDDIFSVDRNGGVKIVITFDDGYEDNYVYALPVLKKYALPATIFITSGFIFDGLDITKAWSDYVGLVPLKKEQIVEMKKSGISFGSHGVSHRRFSTLGKGDYIKELRKSKLDIEANLAIPVNSFAFPFGQKRDRGSYDNAMFMDEGYRNVCTTDWGINKYCSIDLFRLKRIRIDHFDTMDDFKAKLRGKWDFVRIFQFAKSLL